MAATEQPETRDGEKTMLCGAGEALACCVAQVGFELCMAQEALKRCVARSAVLTLSRGAVGRPNRRAEWCGNSMITVR